MYICVYNEFCLLKINTLFSFAKHFDKKRKKEGDVMNLGEKLKLYRQRCGLTQEELGDRCELTKGYISQLENEITSPSIATLSDILEALGTSLGEFFSEEKEDKIVFGRDDYFVKEEDDQSITWLVPNSQKNEMEPIIVTLEPKAETTMDMPHEGEEFGLVLDGAITLHYGKTVVKVKKGETFYIISNKPHYLENRGSTRAKVVWVASPPNF